MTSTNGSEAPLKPYVTPVEPKAVVSTGYICAWIAAQAAVVRSFDDLNASERRLWKLVEAEASSNPVSREGHNWAARPSIWYAEQLNLSEKQINRIVRSIPLCWLQVLHAGQKARLLRIGNPAEKSPEDFARIMAAEWKQRVERRTSRKEYGMLVGVAKDCAQWSPDIFRTAITDWTGFMSWVKIAVEEGKISGDEYCKDPKKFYRRFLNEPSIATFRRFLYMAEEFYNTQLQELFGCKIQDKNLQRIIEYRFKNLIVGPGLAPPTKLVPSQSSELHVAS